MARTRKNTVSPSTISLDWNHIDAALKSGQRVSLSHLAQAHKVFPIDLRKIFESRYGDKIIFKRGRTGGVFWKSSTAIAAAAGTQSAPDEEFVAMA
jgi:hypothetical protein